MGLEFFLFCLLFGPISNSDAPKASNLLVGSTEIPPMAPLRFLFFLVAARARSFHQGEKTHPKKQASALKLAVWLLPSRVGVADVLPIAVGVELSESGWKESSVIRGMSEHFFRVLGSGPILDYWDDWRWIERRSIRRVSRFSSAACWPECTPTLSTRIASLTHSLHTHTPFLLSLPPHLILFLSCGFIERLCSFCRRRKLPTQRKSPATWRRAFFLIHHHHPQLILTYAFPCLSAFSFASSRGSPAAAVASSNRSLLGSGYS